MKHVVVMLAVLVVAWNALAADGQSALRTISVSGTAVGYVPADTIVWDVTLQSGGKDLLEAKEASDLQVKSLLDACTKKGIQGADMAVGIIRIQDARAADSSGSVDSAKPFTVTRIVTIRQRDPRQFSDMLEMLGRGRTLKAHYKVVSSKSAQISRETVLKATEAAKEKAAAMATVLGATLGDAINVSEYPPAGRLVPEEGIPVDEDTTVFGADAEKVTMTVYATFELQ